MSRCVVRRFECPANIWTSRRDPPTVEIFLAVLVMKVRRPLWLQQPWKPSCRYHRQNKLTTACGDIPLDLSLWIKKVLVGIQIVSAYSRSAVLSSSFMGITRPDRPLLAVSSRWIAWPIWPRASVTILQVRQAISLALRPALTDKEEDEPVPGGPTRSGEVAQDGIHLPPSQRLRLF